MNRIYGNCVVVLLYLLVGIQPVSAQDIPLEEPGMPGRVEDTGRHFEITDSEYLNITLDSTEEISLTLESVPKMINMHIESATGATSTSITLSGFPPHTTFYKYEDGYHNLEVITTDESGSYSYIQDISTPHLVFIQPNHGTIYIPSDTSIGIWDDVNRIYTLTTDVWEGIQISEDNLTLDGSGHTITSSVYRSGTGIYIPVRTGVTIKNVSVTGFFYGIRAYVSNNINFVANAASDNAWAIRLEFCDDCTLTDNTASNNWIGVYVKYSNNNLLMGNTASDNRWWGRAFYLSNSDHNILRENIALNNATHGIILAYGSDGNTIMDNISSNNFLWGIYLFDSCSNNTVLGNTFSSNPYGIHIRGSSNNVVTGNAISSNSRGIVINSYSSASYDNRVYNNDFIDNSIQAYVYGGSGNIFNLDKPIGGNYWSNWICPDADGDGFVDYPYIFTGGQDNLPLVPESGCINAPPVANAGSDQTMIIGETVQFDGSASFDPDGIIVSYEWEFGDGTPLEFGVVVTHAYSATGVYSVTLTVTDNYGATRADTATVEVLTPVQAIGRLIALVESMNLQSGILNSLDAKLDAARASLDAANAGLRNDAINKLEAFRNAVEAQSGKELNEDQADGLIGLANRIISVL